MSGRDPTRWLFPSGEDDRSAWARRALIALIGIRIAVGPYRGLAGQPRALFRPLSFVRLISEMPSVEVIVALQVVGVLAAIVALTGRVPRASLIVAWSSFLVLAGLRSSMGKVLHNDVLLLLVAVPFLAARPREAWPLRVGLVTVTAGYFFAGVAKLRYSGIPWVTSDNLRFLMYSASHSGRAPSSWFALSVAERAWLSKLTAVYIIGLELSFPVVLFVRRARIVFAVAAVWLHVATWFTLGIDYWLWAAVTPLVLIAQRPVIRAESTRAISAARGSISMSSRGTGSASDQFVPPVVPG